MTRLSDYEKARRTYTRLLISKSVIDSCLRDLKKPDVTERGRAYLVGVIEHERGRAIALIEELRGYQEAGIITNLGATCK